MADNLTAKQRTFLKAYARTCSITDAAKAARIDRCSHHRWMREEKLYATAFDEVKEDAISILEDEAVRRATKGVSRGVMVGKKREVVVEYSDTLLIFKLKAARPEVYRDRAHIVVERKLTLEQMKTAFEAGTPDPE